MTFTDALATIFNDNARVTRCIWNNRAIFISAVNLQLCITGGIPIDGKDPHLPHPFIVTESDYFADDWEVVE